MSVETELLELETEMMRANREGDGGFYEGALRADALLVSRFGVAGRDQVVPMINANRNPFTRTELSDPRVLVIDEANAYITYRFDYTAQTPDGAQDFSSLATSVYTRVDGRWVGVLHQQTPL